MNAFINAIVLEGCYQRTRTIDTWDRMAWFFTWCPMETYARLMVQA